MKEGVSSTDSRAKHAKHCDKVIQKLQQVQGIAALLEEWESQNQDSDETRAYVLHLRAKLRTARTNYEAMRP